MDVADYARLRQAELGQAGHIDRPEYSQPLCTALQIALTELLRSFGIIPSAVVGHSSGEIATAYVAGALSLSSACKAAYHRGQLAEKRKTTTEVPGAMLSVNLSEEQIPNYLDSINVVEPVRGVQIACVNSHRHSRLSGPEEPIDLIKAQLDIDSSILPQTPPTLFTEDSVNRCLEVGCGELRSDRAEQHAAPEVAFPEVSAASVTIPDTFRPFSSQSSFLAPVDAGKEIDYEVKRTVYGRAYATRVVHASQGQTQYGTSKPGLDGAHPDDIDPVALQIMQTSLLDKSVNINKLKPEEHPLDCRPLKMDMSDDPSRFRLWGFMRSLPLSSGSHLLHLAALAYASNEFAFGAALAANPLAVV
ncbi:acyl transferase domain-containing protein [Truncatella angustata]|uniref:Acyl transferase domain-containing protein n=1 Tax=Truncatella angustata TaxID=152316 RepID=A0A9P8UF88_9PEZI|nr:acyl transferase domain-containing protein [Truncatella angustata]KAH6648898.1 acyl transferase domain-containing protein [Truncatella angustata]